MHEVEPTDGEFAAADARDASDPELNELESAFETVDAALKALDADDLDGAEALAASLGSPSDAAVSEAPTPTEA